MACCDDIAVDFTSTSNPSNRPYICFNIKNVKIFVKYAAFWTLLLIQCDTGYCSEIMGSSSWSCKCAARFVQSSQVSFLLKYCIFRLVYVILMRIIKFKNCMHICIFFWYYTDYFTKQKQFFLQFYSLLYVLNKQINLFFDKVSPRFFMWY